MRSEIRFLNRKTRTDERAPDETMVIMSCVSSKQALRRSASSCGNFRVPPMT